MKTFLKTLTTTTTTTLTTNTQTVLDKFFSSSARTKGIEEEEDLPTHNTDPQIPEPLTEIPSQEEIAKKIRAEEAKMEAEKILLEKQKFFSKSGSSSGFSPTPQTQK